MGRLIPAGTGLGAYKRLSVHVDEPAEDAALTPPAVGALAGAATSGPVAVAVAAAEE